MHAWGARGTGVRMVRPSPRLGKAPLSVCVWPAAQSVNAKVGRGPTFTFTDWAAGHTQTLREAFPNLGEGLIILNSVPGAPHACMMHPLMQVGEGPNLRIYRLGGGPLLSWL